MNEATQTEMDHTPDEHRASRSAATSGTAFQAIVALWFAALFGGGCLFLPPVLFDAIFGGNSPFGAQTRIVAAIGAAGIGLLMGLFIASRVRADKADTEETKAAPSKPRKKRKAGTRPPLDVRAALGLDSHDDDDDDDDDALELSSIENDDPFDLDEDLKAPIDDPHFASAWSDSDAYEPIPQEEGAPDLEDDDEETPEPDIIGWQDAPAPTPAPSPSAVAPSRYNPFADFVKDEEEIEDVVAQDHRTLERGPAPDAASPAPPPVHQTAPFSPPAPPPPPAWPRPRDEEPALGELGVAELVERLARALQGQGHVPRQVNDAKPGTGERGEPMRPNLGQNGSHGTPSASPAPTPASTPAQSEIDRALRGALDRLSRLDDVA
tara:strand:- start:261 stop:1400 length:1140 start_codon:yes stop_codon:yes gene_type:complete